jgi:hypothetical protein
MKPIRFFFACASLLVALPAAAGEDEALGHALTLVQTFVHAAARADDPAASAKALDDVLSGRDTKANRAFAGLLEEMTADLPAAQRDRVASIGMDLAALARREAARKPLSPLAAPASDPALQARKDLTAMGLVYYDPRQFLEAVKRDDLLAVELYLKGRGVSAAAAGPDGRTAVEIARANGNERLAGLLSRNPPAGR